MAIPVSINNGEATALITQYCTAWYCACEMVNLFEGDHILVHAAAGGVGTAIIQLAKKRGCIIFGTAGADEKMDYLRELGVDYPINYRKSDFAAEVKKVRGSKGVDVIFDPVGGTNYSKGKKILAYGGRMVNYGVSERSKNKAGVLADLKLAFNFGFLHPVVLLIKSQGMIGVNMLKIGDYQPRVLQRCLQKVTALAEKGEIKPHICAVYKSTDIAEAHQLLESRKSIGKIVVEW